MVTFLITSLVILAFLSVAVYFWQKPASFDETEALLPSPEWRGLFIDGDPDGEISSEDNSEVTATTLQQRTALLDRAAKGEKSALQEARNTSDSEDSSFYEEVLSSLVEAADSGPKLLSLVSYVTRHDLPVNKKLAARFIASCKSAPGQNSAAKMLHVAALSDDAAVYQVAVETVLEFRSNGHLSEISPHELLAILEGEFWLLSANTRGSGAGFLLKRALRGARRELEAAHND